MTKKVMRFVKSASPENSSSALKYDIELKISHIKPEIA